VEVVEVFTMVSSCFARTPCRDHAAPETCDYGFVVNGLEARAKGRNGKSPVISLARSRRCGRDSQVVSRRTSPICAASCRQDSLI